jgi:hypothetical protein
MSWAPYLLNYFLEDCKDTQDWGSEFHYSWLLILIALVGWKEPTYNMFLQRIGKCGTTRYTSLRSTTDPKEKKINNDVFSLYLSEIHNHLADTWRISPETIQEFGQIENFQASHHNMWVQAKRDPTKEWLQLSYCMTMQDIQDGGPGVAQGMESVSDPKDSARRTDSDRTNSPCATDRQKQCEKKEECHTRPSGGKHPHTKEKKDTEEITVWFYMGSTAHREGTKRNNITGVHRRSTNKDTRNTHGGRNWAGYMHGYTDARGI